MKVGRYLNKRKLGAQQEETVIQYLKKNGMRIVAHNFRIRQGEIDVIGYENDCLVFVEVKYRSSEDKGRPEEAVGIRKQRIICKVADYYRFIHHIDEYSKIRYDVVAVCASELIWYKNAFDHIG